MNTTQDRFGPEAFGPAGTEASRLYITVEKRRYGKPMTVVDGFDLEVDVERVARELKRRLGAGGGCKNGRLELQGDHSLRLGGLLREMGFVVEGPTRLNTST